MPNIFFQYATSLKLHGRWPSYKPYGVEGNRVMDGCPTNCHTHVLTVTNKDDSVDLAGSDNDDFEENGTIENGNICVCMYFRNILIKILR